jgi:hypothetical protein
MFYSATVTIAAGSPSTPPTGSKTLRTHLTEPLQNLQYSVAFNASSDKVDVMRQTVLPQLMEESRRAAQVLAAAAGAKLGGVRSVSDSGGVYAYVGASRAPISAASSSGYPSALGALRHPIHLLPETSSSQPRHDLDPKTLNV